MNRTSCQELSRSRCSQFREFSLSQDEALTLLGENYAGKSTMCYVEGPFGKIIEFYSHSFELANSSGAYEEGLKRRFAIFLYGERG